MTGAANDTPQEMPRISLTFDDGPHPIWTPRAGGVTESRDPGHVLRRSPAGSAVPAFDLRDSQVRARGLSSTARSTCGTRSSLARRSRPTSGMVCESSGAREYAPDSGVRRGACSRPLRRRSPTRSGSSLPCGRRAPTTGGETQPPRCWSAWDPSLSGLYRADARWNRARRPPIRLRRDRRPRGGPRRTHPLPRVRARPLDTSLTVGTSPTSEAFSEQERPVGT